MKSVRRLVIGMLMMVMAAGALTGQAAAASALKTVEKKCTSIAAKETADAQTEKDQLKALFMYVENNYGYKRAEKAPRTKADLKSWTNASLAGNAKKTLASKSGSCYDFAALYAFLAKKVTDAPVRVILGETKGFGRWQKHAWTEIKMDGKWYICDTNLDKFSPKNKLKQKYFMKAKTSSAMKKIYRKGSVYKAITVKF